MAKLRKMIALILISCLTLTGCYDASEIDEQVYALAIGVDKGVENAIRVTFQYATYKDGGGGGGMGGGGGGGGEKDESGEVDGTIVTTVEASSLLEAMNVINTSTNRRISLMHTKMLVFAEDYAKEGVARYVEPLVRFRELRELMSVVICKGMAEDFLTENKAFIGTNPSKAMEITFQQSKNTGYFPDTRFKDFYVSLLTPYGQPTAIYAGVNEFNQLDEVQPPNYQEAPLLTEVEMEPGQIPRKGATKREMLGTAVFDGDRMVGTLFQHETRLFLMATGKYKRGFFTLEDENKPGYIYVLEIQLSRAPRVSTRFEKGKPVIDLELVLDVDVISIQSRKHYEKLGNIQDFEQGIAQHFEQELNQLIAKTQDMNADIFYFGKKIAGHFLTIQELDEYNWKARYKDAEINPKVEAHVHRSGYVFGATPIRSTEGKDGEEEQR